MSKSLCRAAMALLLCTPAFAAGPVVPQAACPAGLTALDTPGVQAPVPLACTNGFCHTDSECRQRCPSATSAICSPITATCVYSGGGGGSVPGCQSGNICAPSRFCISNANCTTCTGGCQGYCASDGICRVP